MAERGFQFYILIILVHGNRREDVSLSHTHLRVAVGAHYHKWRYIYNSKNMLPFEILQNREPTLMPEDLGSPNSI